MDDVAVVVADRIVIIFLVMRNVDEDYFVAIIAADAAVVAATIVGNVAIVVVFVLLAIVDYPDYLMSGSMIMTTMTSLF